MTSLARTRDLDLRPPIGTSVAGDAMAGHSLAGRLPRTAVSGVRVAS